ncbi:MAG: 5-formyltetrahydrofolate cyclo-ligase [Candidatus Asgardarchaeia archaeon]
MNEISKRKKEIREFIWNLLENKNVVTFPRPVYGRIPNFKGSEIAAKKLTSLDIFKNAEAIFSNPDAPQQPVRYNALASGKYVIMATPKLKKNFLVLDPRKIPSNKLRYASTIKGAFIFGRNVADLSGFNIELKVVGSVAVWKDGARLGKGGGFSDIEFGILREFGWIKENIPVVTTVHDLQLYQGIPMTQHDVPVDIIVTPTQIIRTSTKYKKPKGIYWEDLPREKIEQIPLLKKLRKLSSN